MMCWLGKPSWLFFTGKSEQSTYPLESTPLAKSPSYRLKPLRWSTLIWPPSSSAMIPAWMAALHSKEVWNTATLSVRACWRTLLKHSRKIGFWTFLYKEMLTVWRDIYSDYISHDVPMNQIITYYHSLMKFSKNKWKYRVGILHRICEVVYTSGSSVNDGHGCTPFPQWLGHVACFTVPMWSSQLSTDVRETTWDSPGPRDWLCGGSRGNDSRLQQPENFHPNGSPTNPSVNVQLLFKPLHVTVLW